MKKLLIGLCCITVFICVVVIFNNCSKRDNYIKQKTATLKDIPDSLASKSELIDWLIQYAPRDSIMVNQTLLETINLAKVDENNIFQYSEITIDQADTIKKIIKLIICQEFNLSYDSIVEDTCISCQTYFSRFHNYYGLYLVYNDSVGPNNDIIGVKDQLIFLDFHYRIIQGGILRSLHRSMALLINVNEMGEVSYPYKNGQKMGINITYSCDPVGGDPCGCCEFFYAHWWSFSRTCACNHSGIPNCQTGECYEHYTVTLNISFFKK